MNYSFLFAMVLLALSPVAKGGSNELTLVCPSPDQIRVTKQSGSWASYRYDADIPIALPALGNTLHMTAEGDAPSADYFYAATWTDRTFLCLYNAGLDAIVLFDTQLDPYVANCAFDTLKGHSSECTSGSPSDCPLHCKSVEK